MKGKGFMKGVRIRNFLDTVAEWHALVQGFCEVLCPWPARHNKMTEKLAMEVQSEHHYYMAGRVAGKVCLPLYWIGIALLVRHVFF